MPFMNHYLSPLGTILLAADEQGLTGLWFAEEKIQDDSYPVFDQAKAWLDQYFAGNDPQMDLPIHLSGTPFQMEVWEILTSIPYGKTVTYGQIAQILADRRGLARMSAQAVGQAVGKNPISIVVPCHRVVGSKGNLVGYGGGLERKAFLLEMEKS